MTTYREPASTETDPLAPIVAALMKALANNPIAIAEGASGAPRIVTAALQSPTAGDTYPIARMRDLSLAGAGTAYGDVLNISKSGTIRATFDVTVPAGVTATVELHRVGSSDVVVWSGLVSGSFTKDVTITRSQYLIFSITVTSGTAPVVVENILFSSGTDGGFLA